MPDSPEQCLARSAPASVVARAGRARCAVARALGPRSGVSSSSSCRAVHTIEHRRAAGRRRRGAREVEQRRLRPVDVVEHDDERAALGEDLDEPPDGPEDLGRAGTRSSPGRSPRRGGRRRPGSPTSAERAWPRARVGRVVLVDAGRLADDLDQRPEGDAVAVRQAAAADDVAPRPRSRPGTRAIRRDLPTPGVADDRHRCAGRGRRRPPERLAGAGPSRRSRPTMRRGRPRRSRSALADGQQPVRGHPLGLALELQRLDRLDLDRVARRAGRSARR